MNVYIFGNVTHSADAAAVRLIPILSARLPAIRFIHADPTEEWFGEDEPSVCIIDTVHGIDRITVFSDIGGFAATESVTVHDFDLATELTLLTKLGRIGRLTIIGIPVNAEPETVADTVVDRIMQAAGVG
jgi:hypothetical protein